MFKRRLPSLSTLHLGQSGVILKRAPIFLDSERVTDTPKKAIWETMKTRSISALIMISGLLVILFSGPLSIVLSVAIIQTLVFKEVISIGHLKSKEKKLPWFRSINWYFLFCSNYFLYGESIAYHFKHHIYADAFLSGMANHHHFISFCLYILGIILFVLNLRKGHYKFQFSQFAFTHMALLLVVFQSHFIIHNIFEGLVWFVLPVSLVTLNDVGAYFCGVFFGRTPLIKVSPRKTWEGFIGGFLFTVVFGFLLSGFLAKFPYMTCPVGVCTEYYDLVFCSPLLKSFNCEPSKVFAFEKYAVPPFLASMIRLLLRKKIRFIWICPIQWHSLALSCFASAVAPFGGFFASGFKRAFKLKDFSDSIPGHGGVADRVDCQLVNSLFTYLYLATFIKSDDLSVGILLEMTVKHLSAPDQRSFYFKLQDYLIGQGLLPEV